MEWDGWDDCILLQHGAIYWRAQLISTTRWGKTKRPTVTGLPYTVASTMGWPWSGLVHHFFCSSPLPRAWQLRAIRGESRYTYI